MAYSMDLSGRVALVTGASGGLGTQFAKTLSRAGAAVVLASRNLDKLKELRAQIEAEGGDAHVVSLDVTDYASASRQDTSRYKAFFHEMLARGVYLPPSAYEAWFVSAAHDSAAVDRVAEALPHAARAAAAVSAPDSGPSGRDRA